VNTQVRVLIIADSLGCARPEITVNNVWTDRILKAFSEKGVIFYTILSRGLTTNHLNYSFIELLQPDIIILQIGIVDCVRRALSKRILSWVKRIPIFKNSVRKFVRKHHFLFTKTFETRYTTPKEFKKNIQLLSSLAQKVVFIRIADAGETMNKITFNCQKDIDMYNQIIAIEGQLIDPYKSFSACDYIIESDGHHLNDFGQDLVFQSVKKVIDDIISMRDVNQLFEKYNTNE
jgi:acyl-CoA thioesterase I